jgi:uncharacterized coiled-coil DUF342 family protein
MTRPFLSIGRIERRLATGNTEDLVFKPGVNVVVGRPNTGKTKWLQTLDFLLGDPGENPFEGAEETGLADKYDSAAADLVIGDERVRIERRWREAGAKTKIFVDDNGMTARDFQQWLMGKLGIPLLNFPKGNPTSGQTWPELSFRMLLRHIYRQQRFWGDIADKQPEGEQHACILQFLGLAEHIFNDDYGQLIKLKMQSERLRARRDQYAQTLEELGREIVSEPGMTVGVTTATIKVAEDRLSQEIESLRSRRTDLLSEARDRAVPPKQRGRISELSEKRAVTLVTIEELRRKAKESAERLANVRQYRTELADELERMTRAKDAGAVLADLKITHCPACDQAVSQTADIAAGECFLCHQHVSDEPLMEELGAVRLRFERDRLNGELKEANALVEVLERDAKRIANDLATAQEDLKKFENELAPARQAVSALVQEDVSAIDMALGEANERQRQLGRITAALTLGEQLTKEIEAIEREIEPLRERVDEAARATDFDAATAQLEDGMNAYLTAINELRPGAWRHNPVTIDASRSAFTIRVGARRWHAVLGGTDTLYFLMAYQYGLLTLSDKPGRHYPGLSIIDVPGEFSGEAVEDKENFIVQPFIDLLSRDQYKGGQLLITGASFSGLKGAHRLQLTHVYTA